MVIYTHLCFSILFIATVSYIIHVKVQIGPVGTIMELCSFCYYFKGAVDHRVSSSPKYFEFASLCSFICLQAVYQLSGPVCKATLNGCPSYSASHLHFTLCD